jgi:tetratricopeptide (TPR) repeat protein
MNLPMSRLTRSLPAIAVVALAAVLFVARDAVPFRRADVQVSAPLVALPATLDEAATRDQDIAFYTRRTLQDTSSATDRFTLAGLFFARARATGSQGDLQRAETLARQSVGLRTQRNSQALDLLASVLMAKHEFHAAHELAARADSLDPGTPSHLALLGEIELELGEYDAASAHFKAIHVGTEQFTIGARLARWHELTGRIDLARQYLTRAIGEVDRRDDLPREQIAWFHYRLGELELRAGNVPAAKRAFRVGLARHPDDVRALGGLARAELAAGNWKDAIDAGERATMIQLDPTTLGAISLAYASLGDTVQAASVAKAMSVSALTQPGAIHRAWGLFLLDHGSATERKTVLARARLELRDRHDVYGHDLLAWALYRNGEIVAARAEMALALSQGTQDVMLAAHARAIGTSVTIATPRA